jgi:hypothetical protein
MLLCPRQQVRLILVEIAQRHVQQRPFQIDLVGFARLEPPAGAEIPLRQFIIPGPPGRPGCQQLPVNALGPDMQIACDVPQRFLRAIMLQRCRAGAKVMRCPQVAPAHGGADAQRENQRQHEPAFARSAKRQAG